MSISFPYTDFTMNSNADYKLEYYSFSTLDFKLCKFCWVRKPSLVVYDKLLCIMFKAEPWITLPFYPPVELNWLFRSLVVALFRKLC